MCLKLLYVNMILNCFINLMLIMYFKSNIFDNVDLGFFFFLIGRDRIKNLKLDFVVILIRGK